MKKNIVLSVLCLGIVVSLNAYDTRAKYDDRRTKLSKDRDIASDSRNFKSKMRDLNKDIDKLIKKRKIKDEMRNIESSIRKELRRAF